MGVIDKIIFDLFTTRWCGDYVLESIDRMKAELCKNLTDQLGGYWSGHTAYHIMIDGGFLKDAKSGKPKTLTAIGQKFMDDYQTTKHNESEL